jgi:hypothetical protein
MRKTFTGEERTKGLNEVDRSNAKGYANSVTIDPSKPRTLEISGIFFDKLGNSKTTILVELQIITIEDYKTYYFPFRELREDEIEEISPVELIQAPWKGYAVI